MGFLRCSFVLILGLLGSTYGFVSPRTPSSVRPDTKAAALVLSDLDTMTLNYLGLAVGTLASMIAMRNPDMADQIREAVSGSPSPVISSSGSAALNSSSSLAFSAVAVPVAPVPVKVAEVAKPVAKQNNAPVAKVSVASMKETQKEIKQSLQQVGSKLQSASTPLDSVYTEPYSDKVKRSIKRKSRVMEKLTKKLFMPWKSWDDL